MGEETPPLEAPVPEQTAADDAVAGPQSDGAAIDVTAETQVEVAAVEAAPGAPPWTYEPTAVPAISPVPPPPPSPTPIASPPSVSLGIVGKHRMPAVIVLLSVITLGIYSLVWHARVNREMNDFDTRMHVRIGESTWAVVIPWLLGIASSLAGAGLLLSGPLNLNIPFCVEPTPIGWILVGGIVAIPYLEFLLSFSLVAVVMTAERVRVCEDRIGLTTDVQFRAVASAAWLLFPVIGGLILIGRLQRRLNGVWERVAPAASQRRQV